MRTITVLSLIATAVAASPSLSAETIHDGAAPILSSTDAETIPGHYIIKFKKDASEASVAEHHSWIQQLHSEAKSDG